MYIFQLFYILYSFLLCLFFSFFLFVSFCYSFIIFLSESIRNVSSVGYYFRAFGFLVSEIILLFEHIHLIISFFILLICTVRINIILIYVLFIQYIVFQKFISFVHIIFLYPILLKKLLVNIFSLFLLVLPFFFFCDFLFGFFFNLKNILFCIIFLWLYCLFKFVFYSLLFCKRGFKLGFKFHLLRWIRDIFFTDLFFVHFLKGNFSYQISCSFLFIRFWFFINLEIFL